MMPAGVTTAAELHAHYMAVRKRIMRAHLKLLPRGGIGPEHCQPGISTSICRPAPELHQHEAYTKTVKVKNSPPQFIIISPWRRPTLRQILRTVAQHFGTTVAEISSGRMRPSNIVRARQIIYYLGHDLAGKTFAEIGRRLKQCDHTSCLHGYRKVVRTLQTDERLAAEIADIKTKLEAQRVSV